MGIHGRGKYTYVSASSVYEGESAEDMMHGQGKFTFASGNVYEGQYADGKKHGQGRFTFASGKVFHAGEWENNQPVYSHNQPTNSSFPFANAERLKWKKRQ